MTIEERLAAARARVDKATDDLAAAIAERDAAVAEARAAGWSLRQVAAAAGVSFGRIRQLEQKGSPDGDD